MSDLKELLTATGSSREIHQYLQIHLWCSMVGRHPPRSRLAPAGTVSRHQMSPVVDCIDSWGENDMGWNYSRRTTCKAILRLLFRMKIQKTLSWKWNCRSQARKHSFKVHRRNRVSLHILFGDLLHTLSPINEVSLQLATEKCRDVAWSNWISPRVIEHPQFQGIGCPPKKGQTMHRSRECMNWNLRRFKHHPKWWISFCIVRMTSEYDLKIKTQWCSTSLKLEKHSKLCPFGFKNFPKHRNKRTCVKIAHVQISVPSVTCSYPLTQSSWHINIAFVLFQGLEPPMFHVIISASSESPLRCASIVPSSCRCLDSAFTVEPMGSYAINSINFQIPCWWIFYIWVKQEKSLAFWGFASAFDASTWQPKDAKKGRWKQLTWKDASRY